MTTPLQEHGRKENLPSSSSRRLILFVSTYATFALGALLALIPFGKSFLPSRRAVAVGAPVDVDIADMQPGEMRTVEWRGRPVWVVRRTPEMVNSLSLVTDLLADPLSQYSEQPDFAQTPERALQSQWLVTLGVCTHLGCAPLYKPGPTAELGDDWVGGFYCPCHGSRFDLSGRVFKNMPAPTNLSIPDYVFISDNVIRIGESNTGGVA